MALHGAGWDIYLTGFAVFLCLTWAAFSIDFPQRSSGCAECDAEHRATEFMRDAIRAQGPHMVVMLTLLNSLIWPCALLGGVHAMGAHRKHAKAR